MGREENLFYIPCQVRNGVFPNEYAATVIAVNGSTHTTLLAKDSLKIGRQPRGSESGEGLLPVYVVDSAGKHVLVGLPGEVVNSARVLVERNLLQKIA